MFVTYEEHLDRKVSAGICSQNCGESSGSVDPGRSKER